MRARFLREMPVAVVLPVVDPVLEVSGSASSFRAFYLSPYYYLHPAPTHEHTDAASFVPRKSRFRCCGGRTENTESSGTNMQSFIFLLLLIIVSYSRPDVVASIGTVRSRSK